MNSDEVSSNAQHRLFISYKLESIKTIAKIEHERSKAAIYLCDFALLGLCRKRLVTLEFELHWRL